MAALFQRKRIAVAIFAILGVLLLAFTLTTIRSSAEIVEHYSFDSGSGMLTIYNNEGAAQEFEPEGVTWIKFGSGVTEIPENAFQNFTDLTSLTFDGDVTVKPSAFGGASQLKAVEFKGTAVLEEYSFGGCNAIETLYFHGETTVGNSVFPYNPKLSNLYIGAPVHLLTSGSLRDLGLVTKLTIPAGSTFPEDQPVFTASPKLEELIFEGDVSLIGFTDVPALKTLVFKGDATLLNYSPSYNVASASFVNASSLTSVTFHGDADIRGGCFTGLSKLETLMFAGEATIGGASFSGVTNLSTLLFGGPVEIPAGSFSGTKVTSLTFPAGSTIGAGSFGGTSLLENVTFEGDVDLAAGGVFSSVTSLKLILCKGDVSFGAGCFYNASALTEIRVDGSASFGSGIFMNLASLETLTVSGDSVFESAALSGATALRAITFGGDVTAKNADSALSNLPSLSQITFGGRVDITDPKAFSITVGDGSSTVHENLVIFFTAPEPYLSENFLKLFAPSCDFRTDCTLYEDVKTLFLSNLTDDAETAEAYADALTAVGHTHGIVLYNEVKLDYVCTKEGCSEGSLGSLLLYHPSYTGTAVLPEYVASGYFEGKEITLAYVDPNGGIEPGTHDVAVTVGNETFRMRVSVSAGVAIVTPPVANDMTYIGQSQVLVSEGNASGYPLVYSLDGITYSCDLPVAKYPGEYTVYYRFEGNAYYEPEEGTITVTIKKQPFDLNLIVFLDPTYTGAPAYLAMHFLDEGRVEFSLDGVTYSSENPVATDAGDYTIYYRAKETDYEYGAEGSATVTISKADPVYFLETNTDLVYSGAPQSLFKTVVASDCTAEFSFDGVTYTTDHPTATEAGVYTVYYRILGSQNYSDGGSGRFEITIAKATPTVTAPTAKNPTYNGKAQALISAGSTDVGTLEYSLDGKTYSATIPSATDAGVYTVYYRVAANASIESVAAKSISVTVAKAAPTVTAPTAKAPTYNGKAQTLVKMGSTDVGTMEYSIDGTSYSYMLPVGTDAGVYTVYYRVKGDGNYADVAPETLTVTIAKATVTVTPDDLSVTRGDSLPTLTFTASGFFGSDGFTTAPTVSTDADLKKCGEYDLTATGGNAGASYNVVYAVGSLTVTEPDGLSAGAVVAIASGSTVAVGAGGFSLFWFVLKKKTWADLLAIVKK